MKTKKFLINKKGFTLIELIIYLAIASFLVTSLILIFLNLINSQQKNFYSDYLNKEKLFLRKKILWLLEESTDFTLTTSTNFFEISFYNPAWSQPQVLSLNQGRIYLNGNFLTSRYFDYSFSNVEVLNPRTLNPKGLKIFLQPNYTSYLNISKPIKPLEIIFYYKNE